MYKSINPDTNKKNLTVSSQEVIGQTFIYRTRQPIGEWLNRIFNGNMMDELLAIYSIL